MPLGFEQFALAFKLGDALVEFRADGHLRAAQFVVRGDELLGGINRQSRHGFFDLAGQRIEHS